MLDRLEPMLPPAASDEMPSAADWFVGYLMLDALIVNSDRHHENWGVLQLPGAEELRRLAPSLSKNSASRSLVNWLPELTHRSGFVNSRAPRRTCGRQSAMIPRD